MAITIVKLFAFIVSNIGTFEFLRRRTKVSVYFLPSLTIALQVTILFLAGLSHILKIVAIIIWALGIVYFVAQAIIDKNIKFLKNYMNIGFLFLVVTLVAMTIFCVGKMYTTWDNFSHWGIVVKQMFTTNRFPNASDAVIFYKEYPLGSSLYIYYFAGFISKSEPLQLLAQIYMIVASVMPVLSFAKKNKIVSLIAALSFTNLFLVYNIYVTDLSVDTLIAIVGMNALLFIFMHCKDFTSLATRDKWLLSIAAGLYLTWVIQIKNSGIFFVILAIIWLIYRGIKSKDFLPRLVATLMPIASFAAWHIHCSVAFNDASTSVHAMTIKNFINVLGTKSAADIKNITSAFIKYSLTFKDLYITIALLLVIGVFVFFLYKEYRKTWLHLFIASIVLFVLYEIGQLGMYFFTMPLSEALELASIKRYTKTILIAMLFIALIMTIELISAVEVKKLLSIVAIVIAIALPIFFVKICTGKFKFAVQYLDYPMTEKKNVEKLKDDYEIEEGSSYTFLRSDEDKGYIYMLGRCSFLSTEVASLKDPTHEELDNIESKYIIILDRDNKEIKEWVKEKFPFQKNNAVIIQGR